MNNKALAGVAQWTSLRTKGFPIRAHAWGAGQLPSRGHVRSNYTLMFLSLFLLPFPTL